MSGTENQITDIDTGRNGRSQSFRLFDPTSFSLSVILYSSQAGWGCAVVDLVFPVRGGSVPTDHAYPLYGALAGAVPAFHDPQQSLRFAPLTAPLKSVSGW